MGGLSTSLLVRTRVVPASIAWPMDSYSSARPMPRPRTARAAHNRVIEDRCANDGVALPGDPVPVLADARIFEPEARPLIQGQHAPGHAGRDVLLGLDGHVVQLFVLLRIGVLAQRMQRDALLLHPAPAFLASAKDLVSIRDEVELRDAHAALFAIAEALKGLDILLEVRADPSHRGRRALG